jgi:hypothetical protein
MLSKLVPSLCYKNLSPDIKIHDQDIEADEYDYGGRLVFRGNLDPEYVKYGLSVYWLYNSDINCIGLSEHQKDNEENFEALWFYNNPFSTMLQEEGWISIDKTIWTLLSNEAYQDCLEENFETVIDKSLTSNIRLITPDMIVNKPSVYECKKCNRRSVSEMKRCSSVKENYFTTKIILFVDSDYIIYTPPENSKIWSIFNLQLPGASLAEQPAAPEELPVPEESQTLEPETEQERLEQESLHDPHSHSHEHRPHHLPDDQR